MLPNVIDPARVLVHERQPLYLTLVNPHPVKGLFVFARIAEQIARRRPEIPILVVDSRARGKALEETGLDLSWAKNLLTFHAFTTPRRQSYRVSARLASPFIHLGNVVPAQQLFGEQHPHRHHTLQH